MDDPTMNRANTAFLACGILSLGPCAKKAPSFRYPACDRKPQDHSDFSGLS